MKLDGRYCLTLNVLGHAVNAKFRITLITATLFLDTFPPPSIPLEGIKKCIFLSGVRFYPNSVSRGRNMEFYYLISSVLLQLLSLDFNVNFSTNEIRIGIKELAEI